MVGMNQSDKESIPDLKYAGRAVYNTRYLGVYIWPTRWTFVMQKKENKMFFLQIFNNNYFNVYFVNTSSVGITRY